MKSPQKKTEPYLYKWTQKSTGKTYYGSKAKKGWSPERHPEYICSSKIVKPMIIANPDDWEYEILLVGSEQDMKYIVELETRLLKKMDARNDPMCYNQHNNDGVYSRVGISHTEETKIKMGEDRTGESHWSFGKENAYEHMKTDNPMFREEVAKIFSEKMTGDGNCMKDPVVAKKVGDTRRKLGLSKGDNNPARRPEFQMTCIHCAMTMHKGMFNRWHGDKCKHKFI